MNQLQDQTLKDRVTGRMMMATGFCPVSRGLCWETILHGTYFCHYLANKKHRMS